MSKTEETALAIPAQNFAIMQTEAAELQEIFAENLGGTLNIKDLDRIKVPSGGGLAWSLPSDGPRPKVAESFKGIIVYFDDRRAYWEKTVEEGGTGQAPDCAGRKIQIDAAGSKAWVGRGKRWESDVDGEHDCGKCPFNQFESAKKGKGKACKERRMLGILMEDSILPVLLNIPATGLADIQRYFTQLIGRKRAPYYGVVTEFSLAPAKNAQDIEFAKVEFVATEVLTADQRAAMRVVVDQIKPALDRVADEDGGEVEGPGDSFADAGDLQDVSDLQ